uniref:Uncharacterized protein n=1 Tax=Utricularia reniformis TaxID=192314 RepID=A0A1Y0B2F3_9LAMI|nr:hypothetical protein AEK19_MT1422 [Utricularia reniformis]ART31616.1 hypothetical protein AEK19_MT1422 [Utricularia reniformis]
MRAGRPLRELLLDLCIQYMYISLFHLCCPILRRRVNLRNPRGANPYLNVLILFLVHPTTRVQWPLLLQIMSFATSSNWIISTAGASVLVSPFSVYFDFYPPRILCFLSSL